jgi:hypothetical protein
VLAPLSRVVVLTVFVVLGQAAAAPASSPCFSVGPELQINDLITATQQLPAIAGLPNGRYVAVWESEVSTGDDQSGTSIQARLLAADGTPIGSDFQVNTFTPFGQHHPAVAAGGSGFVVAWDSDGSPGTDTSSFSIQARRFDLGGNPLGDQFQANTYTDGVQRIPSVAMTPGGAFVVVWHSFGSSGDDDSSASVQGRFYQADGTPHGNDVQLNTVVFHRQKHPAVAIAADGSSLVVWQDEGTASIKGRQFGPDGAPAGNEVRVNTEAATFQENPNLAMDPNGQSLVVWEASHSEGSDDSEFSIKARRVSADGTPLGVDLQVNDYTAGMQRLPAVGASSRAGFLVAWQSVGSAGSDASGMSIQARWVGSTGNLEATDFQVNAFAPGDQHDPVVAGGTGDGLVLLWQSEGSALGDFSESGILGRWLGRGVFCDGFETGDIAAWSSP